MRATIRPLIDLAALITLSLALTACGGSGSGGGTGPTTPQGPQATASCSVQSTVDIQPGQTAALTAEQAACFKLAPHAGARYALAGFDARAIEGARGGPEPVLASDPVYVVGDGSAATPTVVSGNRAPAPAGPGDMHVRAEITSDPYSPFSRATPWKTGERFTLKRFDTSPATAKVVKVIGRYVFALVEADEESHTGKLMDDTETALEYLQREGFAVMDRVWGGAEPATSQGSGQMLIVFGAWNIADGAGATTTYGAPDGSGIGSFVWLNLNARPGVGTGFNMIDVPSYRLKVLAHELTHAWQARYAYDSQPAGPRSVAFGPAWATEGTADLVAMDIVRRSLGVSLTSNWNWQDRLRAPNPGITFAMQPTDTRGRVSRGYADAASFLQDVEVRMARRGVAADEALAQVARGAMEGWYGTDAAGVRRQGLSNRVRAVLGAGWEPADAVLLWTLTQAADDQTDFAELNNPVYDHAADPGSDWAWKAALDEVQPGQAFAYQVQRTAGSSFFVRVKDGGSGGTVSLSASVGGTRWMIARLK